MPTTTADALPLSSADSAVDLTACTPPRRGGSRHGGGPSRPPGDPGRAGHLPEHGRADPRASGGPACRTAVPTALLSPEWTRPVSHARPPGPVATPLGRHLTLVAAVDGAAGDRRRRGRCWPRRPGMRPRPGGRRRGLHRGGGIGRGGRPGPDRCGGRLPPRPGLPDPADGLSRGAAATRPRRPRPPSLRPRCGGAHDRWHVRGGRSATPTRAAARDPPGPHRDVGRQGPVGPVGAVGPHATGAHPAAGDRHLDTGSAPGLRLQRPDDRVVLASPVRRHPAGPGPRGLPSAVRRDPSHAGVRHDRRPRRGDGSHPRTVGPGPPRGLGPPRRTGGTDRRHGGAPERRRPARRPRRGGGHRGARGPPPPRRRRPRPRVTGRRLLLVRHHRAPAAAVPHWPSTAPGRDRCATWRS